VVFGRNLLKVIPLRRVQQIAAVALVVLAIASAVNALR
jgi:putative Ca2+/H+ antiporter (TMEM165/GDT1 family)